MHSYPPGPHHHTERVSNPRCQCSTKEAKGYISILSCSCSPHLEHLSIICHPFYLPREFSSIVVTAVYIPPQADTSLALSKLHDVLSGYINKHPDAAFVITGDYNKVNLKKVMPNFHQHICCPTRGPNTLDHCYTQFKNAYKAHSLPAFGKSDHGPKIGQSDHFPHTGIQTTDRPGPPGGEGSDALVLPTLKSSQVTFIYIALLTIQIVTKHCTISK